MDIPRDLEKYFLGNKQEIEEGDYMIITNERCSQKGEVTSQNGKKNIIIKQLKQLGLIDGKDYIVYTKEKDENEN